MSIEQARDRIERALAAAEAYHMLPIAGFLKEALAALQPQRYVLHECKALDNVFIVDTQHPEYGLGALPHSNQPWVRLSWFNVTEREREKAREIVELLNTATHEDTTK